MKEDNLYIKKIIRSLDKDSSVDKENITRFKGGYNSEVYEARINGENVVIKIRSRYEGSLKKDVNALKFIEEKIPDFPVPRVVKFDNSNSIVPFSYSILTRIEGKTLDNIYESIPNIKSFFRQLGELKGKLNSMEGEYFAELNSELSPKYKSEKWAVFMDDQVKKILEKIKGIVSSEFIETNRKFWEEVRNNLNQDIGPFFCHGDTGLSNIMVDENYNITGLIDFEHARFGAGIHDFFTSIKGFDKLYSNARAILKGYSRFNTVPKNWRCLAQIYKWFAYIKQVSYIDKMTWRGLSKKQEEKRREKIMERSLDKIEEIKNKF